MKQKEDKKIKEKKLSILLLQSAIVIGCIIIFCVVMTPKDRVKDTTYSYSKLEEVKEYKIEGNYITRVRPLTKYETFKETAEYTLNNNRNRAILANTLKVYTDSSKTEEVREGYIKSGMLLEGISNNDSGEDETVTYTIGVIGDLTKDGDINITELTKIIKGVVGLNNWKFTEEEKLIADFNGDKEVNVVDIEECINYIVYGKLTLENGTKLKSTDENGITWNYTYQNGEATDVHYESGELTETVNIPASLDGYPVVSLYNSSLKENSHTYSYSQTGNIFAKSKYDNNIVVKKITVPNTVGKIGRYAFWGCESLESIGIPNSVKSIGDFAFYNCRSLDNITILEGVANIGGNAFQCCYNLTSIEIPNSITSIGNSAFENCTSLMDIQIPNSVTSIENYVFSGCESLTDIQIPDSVISIGDAAFNGCQSLASIEIPNSVTSIGSSAFSGCESLTDIQIPDSVMSIGGGVFSNTAWYNNQPDGVVYAGKIAYEYKGNMPENTDIELREGTISISGDAFESCKGLRSVEIPNSVTSIGDAAFYECKSLTSITIPDSVESIGRNVFYNTGWYNNQQDGVVYAGKVAYKYKGTMTENTDIELREGTKSISYSAFASCTGLRSIEIPDSVTSIEEGAFYSCSSLTSITIPEGVNNIKSITFKDCRSLKSVELPSSLTSIEYSGFENCLSLTSITIPEGVKSIKGGAFENCTSLKSIVIWKNIDELGYRTFYQWTDSQTINIESKEVTEGWDEDWDYGCNAKIVYGYTGD